MIAESERGDGGREPCDGRDRVAAPPSRTRSPLEHQDDQRKCRGERVVAQRGRVPEAEQSSDPDAASRVMYVRRADQQEPEHRCVLPDHGKEQHDRWEQGQRRRRPRRTARRERAAKHQVQAVVKQGYLEDEQAGRPGHDVIAGRPQDVQRGRMTIAPDPVTNLAEMIVRVLGHLTRECIDDHEQPADRQNGDRPSRAEPTQELAPDRSHPRHRMRLASPGSRARHEPNTE